MIRHEQNHLISFSYHLFAPFPQVASLVSSRLGGVSQAPYASLNLALSVGDDQEAVLTNRARLCETAGIDATMLTIGLLIHGTHIAQVTDELRGKGALSRAEALSGTDGLITNLAETPLIILVADCAVLSFFDPTRHAIGVGHAGWRGTLGGIARKMVAAMNAAFDCHPADLRVGISPSIGPCCFQVRQDVVSLYQQAFPDQADSFVVQAADGSTHLDLWSALTWQLRESGIKEEHIELSGLCTACTTSLFYSHRAEQGKTGRFGGLVVLRSAA
jgi:YfiH family protein